MLQVNEGFVIEAHKSACSTWKRKIEAQFPEIFQLGAIADLPEYQDFLSRNLGRIERKGDKLLISLPYNNRIWTLSAWKLAIAICELYPKSFPRHEGDPQILVIEDVYE